VQVCGLCPLGELAMKQLLVCLHYVGFGLASFIHRGVCLLHSDSLNLLLYFSFFLVFALHRLFDVYCFYILFGLLDAVLHVDIRTVTFFVFCFKIFGLITLISLEHWRCFFCFASQFVMFSSVSKMQLCTSIQLCMSIQ